MLNPKTDLEVFTSLALQKFGTVLTEHIIAIVYRCQLKIEEN